MDQDNITETVLDKMIDLLPDEAIKKLNEMPDDVDDDTLKDFFEEYDIDIEALAGETIAEEEHE